MHNAMCNTPVGPAVAEHDQDAPDASVSGAADDLAVSIADKVPEGALGTTAFFLFSNVHRDVVKTALQARATEGEKVSVGTVAKSIGVMWKRCSDDVKAAYAEAAKAVRHGKKRHRMLPLRCRGVRPISCTRHDRLLSAEQREWRRPRQGGRHLRAQRRSGTAKCCGEAHHHDGRRPNTAVCGRRDRVRKGRRDVSGGARREGACRGDRRGARDHLIQRCRCGALPVTPAQLEQASVLEASDRRLFARLKQQNDVSIDMSTEVAMLRII